MRTSAWFSRIRLVRYAPDSDIQFHRHAAPSLCLLAGGRYEERIRGRDAWHAPGEMLFCPVDEPHAQAFGREGAWKIQFDLRQDTLDYLHDQVPLADAPSAGSPRLGMLARRLRAELSGNRDDNATRLAVEGLALESLAEFGRHADSKNAAEPWLQRARAYVHDHAFTGFSMGDLAGAVGRHPAHLARGFRTAFGSTVGDLVRELRVQEAARLLRETRLPIAEIAAGCGFTDQAHLTRRFRIVFGTTPARFRRDR